MLSLRTWTLNRLLFCTADNVRLGVAMLKVTSGVGCSERDVKEDMVMPRGLPSPPPSAGSVDVQTTTECATNRMSERKSSDIGTCEEAPLEEVG